MGVHAWEIWNEPNLAGNWGPRVDPTSYAALLVKANQVIKAADPGSFVVSGGLSPAADLSDGSQMSPATFLQDMYNAGAGGSFDAVGMHPYSFPADPLAPSSWNPFYNLPNIYQIMTSHGDGAKQIWLTEWGVPTGTNTAAGAVSLQTQAQMISDAFSAVKQWAWAGPLFYYNWQDGTDPTSIYDSFGLVSATFAAKPALAAFTAAASSLASPTQTSPTTTTTTVAPTTTATTTTKSHTWNHPRPS
jgi:hypothetical protein